MIKKEIIEELKKIYENCHTERVYDIQNRLSNLLKKLDNKSKK